MLLPDKILHSAGGRMEIKLSRLGRPTVLVCHGQDTAKAAFDVNNSVREKYPEAQRVVIASIVDLRSFPSMFHGMVKPELEKAYLKAAGKLPEELDPKEYVIILPDWDGAVTDQLKATGSTKQAVVVVADSKGAVVGTSSGENLGPAALKYLETVLG
jgi:hypothetical protein